jgi:2-polyprenyl-6-methoxyphenol hydroxylase-like FAD-dependent oxidoreductase
MADLARSHAVVIGAGMAGLTAAQAISGHFGKVTIIERDVLPAGAAPRSARRRPSMPICCSRAG